MSRHIRCNTPISFEEVSEGYYAQCPECDEDLFSFEVVSMSDPTATITTMMKVCPNHDGAFDCTPFCRICEGNQEYKSNGYLPCNRFGECGEYVEEDIWHEELGFCVECQHMYFSQELDPFTLERV